MSKHITLAFAALFTILTVGQAQIIITAVFDADLPGGLPKGIEVYTIEDIPDMSIYGVGSAIDGGGTNGVQFTFPMIAMDAYSYLYVASDSINFSNFFGFNADFANVNPMLINGDDAVELFKNGNVIDVFGEIDNDGSGTDWEYKDGWAARNNGTGPDSSVFDIQNWNFSGVGALDNEDTNAGAVSPVPIMMYNDSTSVGDPDVTVRAEFLLFTPRDITIEIGQTVRWTNPETNVPHNVNGGQDLYPCNPGGIFSGVAVVGPWDFDMTFNQPGVYKYQCDPHLNVGMIGTVSVVDPDVPDFPVYDLATLTSVDSNGVADSSGVNSQVGGIVYGMNFRPDGLLFTLIEDSGNGISIFADSSDCYEVAEGDRLIIQGTVQQFNGLIQLKKTGQIEIESTNNSLSDPMLITDWLGEETESKLIKIEGTTVDSIYATDESGWIARTSNSNAGYTIRLHITAFDDPGVEKGDIITVTGTGNQFDPSVPYTGGYILLPRGPHDVEFLDATHFLPASRITMHPNPASDRINFETDLLIESVRVYSMSGSFVALGMDRHVDISSLVPGIYIVKVYTADGIWTDRFIKAD